MEILLHGISKSFDGKEIFSKISMRFGPGGRYALMGPSGGGKTTLLNILMGLVPPDEGSVTDLEGRRLAPVFQEDRLCENLSVGANIRMAARGKLSPRKIEEALSSLLLPGVQKKPARELSGGMMRRVALARALLSGGEIFLFDEPFKGLDEETKIRAMEFSLERTRGKTLIFVTHDLREAEFMQSEVILFPPEPSGL